MINHGPFEDHRPRFVDVTERIKSLSKELPVDFVAVPAGFSLFDGTHALEINNFATDTGILNLNSTEHALHDFDFDAASPLVLDDVLSIVDSLYRLLFVWLDRNEPLSTSVFSCCYVERYVYNASERGAPGLFKNSRPVTDSVGLLLTHSVLSAAIGGIVYFVKYMADLGRSGVIIEEEDLVLRAPGLELPSLDPVDVSKALVAASVWLATFYRGANSCKSADMLSHYLALLRAHVDLAKSMNTAYDLGENCRINTQPIATLVRNAEYILDNIASLPAEKSVYATACFSMAIQKNRDNRRPVNQLADPSSITINDILTRFYLPFKSWFEDVDKLVCSWSSSANYMLLLKSAQQHHNTILAAYIQIFFLRDNKSLFGSRSHYLANFVIEGLKDFAGGMSNILNYTFPYANYSIIDTNPKSYISELDDRLGWPDSVEMSCSIVLQYYVSNYDTQRINDATKLEVKQMIAKFLESLENDVYSLVSAVSHNPSRQRQTLSRSIILLDSLQVAAGNIDLFFVDNAGSDALSGVLESYIYYVKVHVMIEYLLKGTSLEVYELWEYPAVYWYCSNLQHSLWKLVMAAKTFNMSKRAKVSEFVESLHSGKLTESEIGEFSAKFGQDTVFRHHFNFLGGLNLLQKHKQSFIDAANTVVKQMTKVDQRLSMKIMELQAAQRVSYCIYCLGVVYKTLGLIKEPGFKFVRSILEKDNSTKSFRQRLYELRFKSFSTVGTPEMMGYDRFQAAESGLAGEISSNEGLAKHLDEISRNLKWAQPLLQTVSEYWNSSDSILEKECGLAEIGKLNALVTKYLVSVDALSDKVKKGKKDETWELEVDTEHELYPVLYLRGDLVAGI